MKKVRNPPLAPTDAELIDGIAHEARRRALAAHGVKQHAIRPPRWVQTYRDGDKVRVLFTSGAECVGEWPARGGCTVRDITGGETLHLGTPERFDALPRACQLAIWEQYACIWRIDNPYAGET